MKNIIITILLVSFLTSCGGRSSNIVSFTKQVKMEETGQGVTMPQAMSLEDWINDGAMYNIAIDPAHTKFKKHALKFKASISAEPVIVGNKIFVLTKDGFLTALDKNSLEKLWVVDIVAENSKSDYIGGGITFRDDKLYVTNGSQKFNIININNGNVLFAKKFPDILVIKPILDNDIVILQNVSNQTYFLELRSNALIWDYSGTTETLIGGEPIAPVVDGNGNVLISYTSGQVSLVNAKKRGEIWHLDLSADNTMPEYIPVNVSAQPIIEDGHAYVASNNGKLIKVALSSGHIVWSKEIDDVRTVNNAVNSLIMTTNGRQVIAIDKMNGKVIWATDIGEKGSARRKWDPIQYASALLVNEAISIYTSNGEYYKVSSDGLLLERSKIGFNIQFLTITDKMRGFDKKSILISEPNKEKLQFKIFDKFKNLKLFNSSEKKEPNTEDVAPVKPKPQSKILNKLKNLKLFNRGTKKASNNGTQ